MESYYDPKKGLSGVYATYKAQNKYTLKEIKEMLSRQEPYQLNTQKVKVYYFPIVGHGKKSYQADLMFLDPDKGYSSILCIINVITRVAYAYPLKSKSETFEKLRDWFKDNPSVKSLQTDRGSEFTNKKVKGLFKDIDYYQVESDNAQGKVERFNQTLRRLITVYPQSAYKTTKWVEVLPDLLHNYNHRFHRSLGGAPIDANEDEQFVRELEKYDKAENQLAQFQVGDRVRVLTNCFKKEERSGVVISIE